MSGTLVKRKSNKSVLQTLIKEVRILRKDVEQLKRHLWENLPDEDIEDYAHPDEIKKARAWAHKHYPPRV